MLLIPYALTLGVIGVLQSSWLTMMTKQLFVGPLGGNASPMFILAAIFLLWFFLQKKNVLGTPQWQWQRVIAGSIGWIAAVGIAYWATHPPPERFTAMHLFIQMHPVVGGSVVACMLYAALFLPIIPALVATLPRNIPKNGWVDLGVLLVIFFLSLFIPVIDAAYHMIVSPTILATVHALLSPLGGAIAEPEQLRLGFRGFEVIVGPICSGLNMLTLFAAFMGFLWIHLSKKGQKIHTLRMMTVIAAGLVMLFLLNILRIAFVMIIGSVSPAIGFMLFHSASGLILLLIVCVVWWKLLVRL